MDETQLYNTLRTIEQAITVETTKLNALITTIQHDNTLQQKVLESIATSIEKHLDDNAVHVGELMTKDIDCAHHKIRVLEGCYKDLTTAINSIELKEVQLITSLKTMKWLILAFIGVMGTMTGGIDWVVDTLNKVL